MGLGMILQILVSLFALIVAHVSTYFWVDQLGSVIVMNTETLSHILY